MLRMVGFGDNAGFGVPFILSVWKENGWIKPRLVEDTELNQVTLYLNMKMADDENVIENVIQKYENITEDFINVMEKPKKVIEKSKNVIENNVIEKNMVRLRAVMPMYSDRKLLKAANIVGTMMDNPHVSMDELKSMLNVTQRTIARYISDLKKCNVVDRVGPDKGGIWRVNL
jgi:predicted HTH transcriptional regulator